MNDSDAAVIAVDVGGTKFSVGAVNEKGEILCRGQVNVPHHAGVSSEETWLALHDLIARVQTECLELNPATEFVAVGIGAAGPGNLHTGTLSPVNIKQWQEFQIVKEISKSTRLQTFFDNDCKALALGQMWKGAAQGVENFIAMVVSTGVGGGIVLNGDIIDGRLGNAGHIGHLCVDPNGPLCPCGGPGCLESYIAGPAIEKRTGVSPIDATLETKIWAGDILGRAIAMAANLLDLELATVGGSVALGWGDPFFESAQATIKRYASMFFAKDCKIVPVGLGADAPLIGAAAVGWRGLGMDLRG